MSTDERGRPAIRRRRPRCSPPTPAIDPRSSRTRIGARRGVTEYWTSVTEAQDDVTVRMGRPFTEGDRVAVEFWTTMQAGGSPLTLAGCLLLEFAGDGRCRHLREYWNLHDQIVEPPDGWGA